MTATYRQVKADLLEQITKGAWPPGGQMPGEAALAAQYNCARATVNRAMRELVADGIIERKRKAGTRVRMAPLRQARFAIPLVRQEIEEQGATYRYGLLHAAQITAPDWLCKGMKLNAGQEVLHLTCLHSADNTPYQFEERWINLAVAPMAAQADFSQTGPNEWLVAALPFSSADISFQAVEADDQLARHLACPVAAALFQVERTTWWEGAAITFVRLTHRPGHRMTTQY